MSEHSIDTRRTIGLREATTIGVGAIVGGGILVLAGVAFQATGPSALLAFLLNGMVAVLTALSFAEISTTFSESGGVYTFAKKVLSVRVAFVMGWFIWFAYIVAGVLYGLGFAAYGSLLIKSLWPLLLGGPYPAWLDSRSTVLVLAIVPSLVYALSLTRKNTGGGEIPTYGKVALFIVLIVSGVLALVVKPLGETSAALDPFFSQGAMGLFTAMGFTFIALQGFDLIATVAGEVKNPKSVIPRSMLLSLGIALIIYIPLLFLVSTVGTQPGVNISEMAAADPETVVALAVKIYMGDFGYWMVILAAIMATLSALRANLMAASRVALSMANDRTLPRVFSQLHPKRQTPVMAIYVTTLTLVAIVLMVPDLAGAGAAASLVFLLSFALTHGATYLARKRIGPQEHAFLTPWFPLVPVVGGGACFALAIFQAVSVPGAGLILVLWLGLGGILYFSLFAEGAELVDASAEGWDLTLIQLRGRSPFVLLPVANPTQAGAMVGIANALAPSEVGRVLVLSVVTDHDEHEMEMRLHNAQAVIRAALAESYARGYTPEALITRAAQPWEEIRRVAKIHRCESLLLGLGQLAQWTKNYDVHSLIEEIGCDVALMKSPPNWELSKIRRILVPVAGRGKEHELRARFLASLCREVNPEITFLSLVPDAATNQQVDSVVESINRLADVKTWSRSTVQVRRSQTPPETILECCKDYDLVILGLGRLMYQDLLDNPAIRVAYECECASIILSRKPKALR
ncbi:MAG: amino acid permease [Myxococcota bacterium]|nr:amino acid permease [Myxococcota bacterium]